MVLQAHDTSDPCEKVTCFDSGYHCFTSQGTLPSVKSSYDVHFLSQYERVNICWLLYWLLQFWLVSFCSFDDVHSDDVAIWSPTSRPASALCRHGVITGHTWGFSRCEVARSSV